MGRFQVMAVLQAARAQVLGLPLEAALSWGLNRAIWYAAAKRGFVGPPGRTPSAPGGRAVSEFRLGDEKAYAVTVEGTTLCTIGGEVQRPEDFHRQVASRFGKAFDQAWREAMSLVAGYPRAVLESGQQFYALVYRPRRDTLAARWNEAAGTGATGSPRASGSRRGQAGRRRPS
ncbi:MAG: hypothetical protein RB150_11170 [Armatimonadota bacterium]|nr:hypothetical protein [Armatimonadota bacterium]MDR7516005.1 hypothetical protein [Armatimonadota bacterium]MDR7612360.1 hypothetical protein [Armatimonadota bacterium]